MPRKHVAFLLLTSCLLLSFGGFAAAQTATTSTSTPPVDQSQVAPAPALPSIPALVIPPPPPPGPIIDLMDYLQNPPTQITLPDGTILNITVPENPLPQQFLNITFSPKIPRVNEDVVATVEDTATNLAEDRIIWTVDGQIVQDQIGGDTLTIRTGAVGQTMDIRVIIDSRSAKQRVSKEVSITPGDVAILWEANTYVPPFYKGKPLPSYQSKIKLVPLPTIIADGNRISPDNLLYQWTRNSRAIKELSGYGKRSSVFEARTGAQVERLLLTVSDPVSGAKTERYIDIEVTNPTLLLYRGSPLLGTRYEETLGRTFPLTDQELSIVGEPYFFSREEINSGISSVSWTQNGASIGSTNQGIIVRREGESSGRSRIEASIANPIRILQNSRASVLIDFQEE